MPSMNRYGKAAVTAAKDCGQNPHRSPHDAWTAAVNQEFESPESRKKSCPRSAFLGLCEEGLIVGIPKPARSSAKPAKNKSYALEAVRLLSQSPSLADNIPHLWRIISPKRHNSQMDVVIALWNAGLIAV